MKKILLIAVAAIVVIGAGVLSVRHYQNYQNKKTHAAQVIADAKDTEITTLQASNQRLLGISNTVRVECEKGRAAYDILPATLKAKVPAPTCGPATVK